MSMLHDHNGNSTSGRSNGKGAGVACSLGETALRKLRGAPPLSPLTVTTANVYTVSNLEHMRTYGEFNLINES